MSRPDPSRRAEALAFDLDGTLVLTEAVYARAACAALREFGQNLTEADYCNRALGRPLVAFFANDLGLAPDVASAALIRARELFWTRSSEVSLVGGLLSFLRRVARLARGVVTSADRRTAERLLAQVGLSREFDVIITADDLAPARRKPEPDAYALAARRLGVESSRCVAFEDSLIGFEAARRAGMHVVALTTSLPPAAFAAALLAVPDYCDRRLGDCFPSADE